jgi:sec-independent protein translocase protein TatB
MLPEIGASELLVIAIVALIVVGPKDLPLLLRRLGEWMAKIRGMAAEFRASFDEMSRQSELDELRQQVDALRKGQIEEIAALRADEAEVAQVFDEIGQGLQAPARSYAATGEAATPVLPDDDGMPMAPPAPTPVDPAPKATKPRAPRKPKGAAVSASAGAAEPAPKRRTKRAGTAPS